MCYNSNIQHKGLEFLISDCFGIGFDWKDKDFQDAVRSKDERIFEILNWAVNGGADRYDDAVSFYHNVTSRETWESTRRHIRYYSDEQLESLRRNEYLSQKSAEVIDLYLSGRLEKIIEIEKEMEKSEKKIKSSPGFVYLIMAENGLYKIGKAKDLKKRLSPFSVEFPMKWELIYSFKSENYDAAEINLHSQFHDKREVGEWFRLSAEDVEYIKSIKDGQI